ncbi:hypothetical protein [Polaribacter gangjinensis]|uniref:AMP-activated protein kinase glycogen-binding domain-containing protein n=1 Tax=Polaribacter gangjinensis TaxID=574710 RepID=A0A2S7W8I8_9FLAO|nr:hypothetical protein [Polaribacter gangjinensis]PQJ73938.1 hypothetical protein BTO13_00975 [Polaribacter gangjinensis]
MKNWILHSIYLIFLSVIFTNYAQEKPIMGYKIEGDYIVFTFDKRDYDNGSHHQGKNQLEFDDFEIKNVVVAGNFNNWSRSKWKMKKIDENIYQLKKKIEDFDDQFNWEFKFVVNNNYWAEPNKKSANLTPSKTSFGYILPTYNYKIIPIEINENGNASFFLNGYKNAKKVVLSGSFNKWDEEHFLMKKTENGWKLTLQLKPNLYEYKFIVDGKWIEDPSNKNKIENEYGEYNSVLDIQQEINFLLEDFQNAKEIFLAGDFNNWSKDSFKMVKTKNGWKYTTKLSYGKHHYKYIVDGIWKLDPKNPVKEYDFSGNINSVKMVK